MDTVTVHHSIRNASRTPAPPKRRQCDIEVSYTGDRLDVRGDADGASQRDLRPPCRAGRRAGRKPHTPGEHATVTGFNHEMALELVMSRCLSAEDQTGLVMKRCMSLFQQLCRSCDHSWTTCLRNGISAPNCLSVLHKGLGHAECRGREAGAAVTNTASCRVHRRDRGGSRGPSAARPRSFA